jgi:leucyl aminopeptidase
VLNLKSVDLEQAQIETLVIPVCEDADIYDDRMLSLLVEKAKGFKEFKGEQCDNLIFYNPDEINAQRVVLLGIGKLEKTDTEALRQVAGRAVKECIRKDLSEVLIAVPSAAKINLETESVVEALMEGGCLGNHLFDKYKQEKRHQPVSDINLLVKPDLVKRFAGLAARIETICQGSILAREWVTMPSNDKRPEEFARCIVSRAEQAGLAVKVLDENELELNKLGAMLAVAAGSRSKPRLVVLEYNPKGSAEKTVALVGKGVTFDSGGINLKPSSGLEEMKMDMAGGATVAATLITVARLKPEIRIIGVIPIVENMPSCNAARPGDIVKSYSGKTVEIGNTDAEGRLILIDAISYAIKEYNPRTLIDMATLTGACAVALGEKIAGVFSFDDKLAEDIVLSGKKTYERCWRMPLPDDYKELIKSDLADIKNMSSSCWGGAITAALFLSEFVEDTRWAHIDIAGPAYIKKESGYCGVGGTGFGVRLFCDLLEKL